MEKFEGLNHESSERLQSDQVVFEKLVFRDGIFFQNTAVCEGHQGRNKFSVVNVYRR